MCAMIDGCRALLHSSAIGWQRYCKLVPIVCDDL